jgi:hypothetical protein
MYVTFQKGNELKGGERYIKKRGLKSEKRGKERKFF